MYYGDNSDFAKLLKTSQDFLRSLNSLNAFAYVCPEEVKRMVQMVVNDPAFDQRLLPFAHHHLKIY